MSGLPARSPVRGRRRRQIAAVVFAAQSRAGPARAGWRFGRGWIRRESAQRSGRPRLRGDGALRHGHQRDRPGFSGRADHLPVGQGSHDGDHLGGSQRRPALMQLVTQNVGMQADGPGQLLLGTTGRAAALAAARKPSRSSTPGSPHLSLTLGHDVAACLQHLFRNSPLVPAPLGSLTCTHFLRKLPALRIRHVEGRPSSTTKCCWCGRWPQRFPSPGRAAAAR